MEIASAHGALERTERLDECKLEVCFHNNAGSQKMKAGEPVFKEEHPDRVKEQGVCFRLHVWEQTKQDGNVLVIVICMNDEQHLVQLATRLERPVHVQRLRCNEVLQSVPGTEDQHFPGSNVFEEHRRERRVRVVDHCEGHRILRALCVPIDKLPHGTWVATEIRQFRNPLDIVFCQSIQFSRFHWPFHVDTSSEIFDDVTPDLSSFAALLASLACNFSTQEFGDRSNPRLTRRGFAKFLQTLTYSRRFSNARRIFCRSVGLRFIFLFGTGVVVV